MYPNLYTNKTKLYVCGYFVFKLLCNASSNNNNMFDKTLMQITSRSLRILHA